MVFIHSWQEFQDAAEALYARSPHTARYVVKWKSAEGKLVLKITDNASCIKFKTYSSIFLNRFEALNLSLIDKMQNRRRAPSKPTEEQAAPAVEKPVEAPAPSAVPSNPIQSASTTGGIKKKKPKKKK